MPEKSLPSQPIEPLYECPVCLGLPMAKLKLDAHNGRLVLDCCQRCGGIWFDAGEAKAFQQIEPTETQKLFELPSRVPLMQCHACHASMARSVAACPECYWPAPLKIPLQEHLYVSNQPIQSNQTSTMPGIAEEIVGEGLANVAVEAIANSPATVEVTTEVAASTIEVLSESLGIGEVVIEVTGKVAAAVVETLVEIVAGLFSS
ncbi:MAG: zf-TFIIB domain-containing protein [Cyanobacteria bacterium J06639_14]